MSRLDIPPPPAVQTRGMKTARDNVGEGQAVSLPAGAIADLFGGEIQQRIQARRPAPTPAPAPPARHRQRALPEMDQPLLQRAYRRAGLAHKGVTYSQAMDSPAVRRCLEIIAAGMA